MAMNEFNNEAWFCCVATNSTILIREKVRPSDTYSGNYAEYDGARNIRIENEVTRNERTNYGNALRGNPTRDAACSVETFKRKLKFDVSCMSEEFRAILFKGHSDEGNITSAAVTNEPHKVVQKPAFIPFNFTPDPTVTPTVTGLTGTAGTDYIVEPLGVRIPATSTLVIPAPVAPATESVGLPFTVSYTRASGTLSELGLGCKRYFEMQIVAAPVTGACEAGEQKFHRAHLFEVEFDMATTLNLGGQEDPLAFTEVTADIRSDYSHPGIPGLPSGTSLRGAWGYILS